MKTRNHILFASIIIIASAMFFISCSDDNGDTTLPVIDLFDPAEGAILKIGSEIHLEMELSDNEMLSSYKVEIHNDFNNHGHTRVSRAEEGTTVFSYQKTWDVSGKRNTPVHHHEIIIPENATPGNYHFMVYCTDAAGNESFVFRNIVLSHEGEGHQD